jgi:integrase/recombinase XerD
MRISEAFNLNLVDVDFISGQIKVMGKGNKQRNLFTSPRLFKALFKYKTQWRPKVTSNYFFVHENGAKLDRFYFEHVLRDYVALSGITKKCTPHSFRYACAIQLLRNGVDPFTVQAILGHATLDMTRHYVRLADTDVENKMKSFSPAEQLDIKF